MLLDELGVLFVMLIAFGCFGFGTLIFGAFAIAGLPTFNVAITCYSYLSPL
jgi:hypothetical protein